MSADHWKVLKRKTILDRPPHVRVYQESVLLEDEQTVVPDFYRIECGDFVGVVAITPEEEIVLLRLYRHGVGERILEIVAGGIEADETPLEAAKRELLEETGCQTNEWISLGSYIEGPNKYFSTANLFLALNVKQVMEPLSGDLEIQTPERIPITVVRNFLKQQAFKTLPTTTALLLALNHLDSIIEA